MILVTGATGFLGRHLVNKFCEEKMETRCLVRPASDKAPLEKCGVDLCEGDVRDLGSLTSATEGVQAVVHLVGIIQERIGVTFDALHRQGTENLLKASIESGVERFVYVSALGTRANAATGYHLSKWDAEEAVRKSGIIYTILRPSVIFGPGDGFVNLLTDLIRKAPVIPVIGSGRYKLQPISFKVVVSAILQSLGGGKADGRVVEMGGADQLEFIEILDIIADALGMRKFKVRVPSIPIRLAVSLLERVCSDPPVTVDQINMLLEDNVCDNSLMHETFDLETIHFEEGIKEYL